MTTEEQIAALRKQGQEKPIGWLICFEDRPLQAVPPKGNGPHLLFFSTQDKAGSFIADRKRYYGEEPLSSVGIDSPDTLKALALNPCQDVRYAAPPCGIVFDFDYSTKKARKVLPPAEVSRKLPAEIGSAFGYKPFQPVPVSVTPPQPKAESTDIPAQGPVPAPVSIPVPPQAIKSKPQNKKPLTAILITCGSLLVVGLLVLCVGGLWFGIRQGAIPAPAFLSSPTATSTPTQTPVPWDVHLIDDFSSNVNGWPLGHNGGQYGSSYLTITGGKLDWEMDAFEGCSYWWHADMPAVSDFDVSVDVKRTGGATTGDYGLIVYGNDSSNSYYYFAIDDVDQKFAFFIFQNSTWVTITDWTYTPEIRMNEVNHIKVAGKNGHFVFSINGTSVGQADDGRLSSGVVGIAADLYNAGDKIFIEYDNLELHGNK